MRAVWSDAHNADTSLVLTLASDQCRSSSRENKIKRRNGWNSKIQWEHKWGLMEFITTESVSRSMNNQLFVAIKKPSTVIFPIFNPYKDDSRFYEVSKDACMCAYWSWCPLPVECDKWCVRPRHRRITLPCVRVGGWCSLSMDSIIGLFIIY